MPVQETETLMSSEPQIPGDPHRNAIDSTEANPFEDFRNLLRGHLSGAFIPNGHQTLVGLLDIINEQDKKQTTEILQRMTEKRGLEAAENKSNRQLLINLLTS